MTEDTEPLSDLIRRSANGDVTLLRLAHDLDAALSRCNGSKRTMQSLQCAWSVAYRAYLDSQQRAA
jgi:hypothetical protein